MSQNTQTVNENTMTGRSNEHIYYLDNKIGIHLAMRTPWSNMQKAALADGIDLQIASGFRDFSRQQSIFERKLSGALTVFDLQQSQIDLHQYNKRDKIKHILLFTALPGASRHHWGTDIDVYAPNLLNGKRLQLESWEYQVGGPMEQLSSWLDANMHRFGFFKPYDIYRNGVAPEPWHLSYRPVADIFQQALTCEKVALCIKQSSLAEQDTVLEMLDWIYQHYIINIQP